VWTLHVEIQLHYYHLLCELEYREYCKQLCYIILMSNLFIHLVCLFRRVNLKLLAAKLALNFKCQAFFLYKKLMEVVYFYGCLQLSLSITWYALDFFKLIKCCELLYIYFIDIDLYCYESLNRFWLCLIDSKQVHPL
jgi:hypothetical protein